MFLKEEKIMNELVFIQNEQVLTTSLKVAEVFSKRHNDVLRAISASIQATRNFAHSEEAFIKSSYVDSTGKSNPMYYLNRDAFSFVVMGFTGDKAAEFKWKYIQAFNAMEKKIIELLAERKSSEWLQVRQSSKDTFKELMQAVHDVVIPNARANGSKTPDNIFYTNYNKLLNKNAHIPAGERDNLPTTQLIMLDQMQNIAAANIRINANQGKGYKEIYTSAKNTVEGYAKVALVAERFSKPLLN